MYKWGILVFEEVHHNQKVYWVLLIELKKSFVSFHTDLDQMFLSSIRRHSYLRQDRVVP